MFKFCVFAVAVMLSVISPAYAHEYYLMPESFTPQTGGEFAVRHRLGQKFKGNELPYIKSWNIRSERWQNGEKLEVRGLDGDRPALKLKSEKSGLLAIIHQSNIDFLTFKTWEKFVKYTEKEGLEHAQQASVSGEYPKLDLKEAYARYAKTLVNIGDEAIGEDIPTGLKIELVAKAHPLSVKSDEPMPIQLLYDGKPLSGAVVKVFVGVGNEFTHRLKTDSQGMVSIPAEGKGPYLLNAIHMVRPLSKKALEKEAHWESFWASLTFERKE